MASGMREVFQQIRFRTDLNRVRRSGRYRPKDVLDIIAKPANDEPLAERYRDHALGGWKDFRDGHIKPDLMLIYLKPDDRIVQLVRIGSHSEPGL